MGRAHGDTGEVDAVDDVRVHEFGRGHRAGVEDLVEDLQALVGEPDLVGVRIYEQPRRDVRGMLGDHGAVLAADVTRRLLHPGQEGLELGPDRRHVRHEATGAGPTARSGGYENRLAWTLRTRPMAMKSAIVAEPP